MYGEKRKAVVFALEKEDERRMYELAKTINFGRFVKRALAQEIVRRGMHHNTLTVNTSQLENK